MAYIDTGFFILMSLISFAFTLMSIKFIGASASGMFAILSFFIFAILAMFLVSDYQVATLSDDKTTNLTINGTTGAPLTNSTLINSHMDYFINDFTTQSIVGMFYFIMALFNVGLSIFAWFPSGGNER